MDQGWSYKVEVKGRSFFRTNNGVDAQSALASAGRNRWELITVLPQNDGMIVVVYHFRLILSSQLDESFRTPIRDRVPPLWPMTSSWLVNVFVFKTCSIGRRLLVYATGSDRFSRYRRSAGNLRARKRRTSRPGWPSRFWLG